MSCCHLLTTMSCHSMVEAEHMNTLNKYGSGCQLYWDQPHHCVHPPSSTPSPQDRSFSAHPLSPGLPPRPLHSLEFGWHWGVKQLGQEGSWSPWDLFDADGGCEICPKRTECCSEQSKESARERLSGMLELRARTGLWRQELGCGPEGKERLGQCLANLGWYVVIRLLAGTGADSFLLAHLSSLPVRNKDQQQLEGTLGWGCKPVL